ncbi:unnamed protein product [Pleuronectes platessa]|uniref:Uncharacterized protein n=1 Tax=Pleuronectes platessa TaxID=8262 RepID=A0A9N7TXC1_PLEPL|nr:unnamed protein product [Pleuronectes platessa]
MARLEREESMMLHISETKKQSYTSYSQLHHATASRMTDSASMHACGRWNNEVDYESSSSVMRRNGSITRYVHECKSAAERGECLGHESHIEILESEDVWVAEKETEKKKNGKTELRQ